MIILFLIAFEISLKMISQIFFLGSLVLYEVGLVPNVGCFVLFMISKFSSFKSKVKILGKDFSMMYYAI
jgi:hypothetical protein